MPCRRPLHQSSCDAVIVRISMTSSLSNWRSPSVSDWYGYSATAFLTCGAAAAPGLLAIGGGPALAGAAAGLGAGAPALLVGVGPGADLVGRGPAEPAALAAWSGWAGSPAAPVAVLVGVG